MVVRFDESLDKAVMLVEAFAGQTGDCIFIRDASGRLGVVLNQKLDARAKKSLEEAITSSLGAYAREFAVRDLDSPGAQRLIEEAKARPLVRVGRRLLHFIDRRTVGADWMRPPARSHPGIPRIAFGSIKGGVGRSTALAVLAAHLSGRGQRVLAIDLDLEAPGIGTMLVSTNALSTYGTLDFLVENGLSGADDAFMGELVAKSYLGQVGAQVSVVPAIGSRTLASPENALAKIARAYLEDVNVEGVTVTLTEQVNSLVERLTASGDYDVVLVDGRAGLHEASAPVLIGLGAELLLFGVDEPQTFQGYEFLMAHMAQYSGDEFRDWRERITFVHAKAGANSQSRVEARERFVELLSNKSDADVVSEDTPLDDDDFFLDWSENNDAFLVDGIVQDVPTIAILDDERYRGFNPTRDRSLLTSDLFSATFGELISWAESVIPNLNEVGNEL